MFRNTSFAIGLTTVLVACGDSTAPDAGAPAALLIVSGDLQADTVGHLLPEALVVRVVDNAGNPVPGQVINFRVVAGAGEVFAGVALTDTLGEARELWTLGTVAQDTQQVEARAVDTQTGKALVFGTFKAVGVADAAATVAVAPATTADSALFIGGDTLLTGDMARFVAVAEDRYGNVKSGPTVTWTSTDTAVVSVAADGTALAKAEGSAGVTATVDAVNGSFTFEIALRRAVALVVVGGDGQADTVDATLPDPFEVRAVDRRGDGFEGAEVTFRGDNAAPIDTVPGCSCWTVVTDADGLGVTAFVLGVTAGEAQLTAVGAPPGGGAPFDTVTISATVQRGNADNMTKVSGGQSATGLIVAIRDRYGNPVSGVVVSWQITSGTGSLSDTLAVSDVNGLAGTSVTSATGAITVGASVSGLNGSPVAFTIVASPSFALDFNQSWVTVPDDPALDLSTTWTIEAWIKPRTIPGSFQHIVSKWDGSGDASYTLEVSSSGRLRSAVHNGTNTVLESTVLLMQDAWQHVAVTYDNGTRRFYINGTLDTTQTGAVTPMNSTRPLSIGREGPPYGGWRYDGLIDEVRVWNVARTGAEIAANLNVRLTGTEMGLVGLWHFDEGSGDVAFDATGNGHNGQLGAQVGADANDPLWTTDVAPIP